MAKRSIHGIEDQHLGVAGAYYQTYGGIHILTTARAE